MTIILSVFTFTPIEVNSLVNSQEHRADFSVHHGSTGPLSTPASSLWHNSTNISVAQGMLSDLVVLIPISVPTVLAVK